MKGEFDVLIGINLLREGLDLPQVSLVAILDADKMGFLRSARSLIQTIGRASRNVNGRVIMYGDKTTAAMKSAIGETNRRRKLQMAFNQKHGITPKTIVKGYKGLSGVLELTTMCGHGLVAAKLTESVMAKVEKGTMTLEEGAKILAQPCPCGIFNTDRCIELLKHC